MKDLQFNKEYQNYHKFMKNKLKIKNKFIKNQWKQNNKKMIKKNRNNNKIIKSKLI